ncbi:MAG: MFS transporter [bacterium]|nr:MFS transporter [bacterium]
MGQISFSTKLAYGTGQVAENVKNSGFNTFLFFYFTQVMGLSGTLAGAAVLVALVFDAVTDPLAGSLSDNWRSRRGRRHPFMYAAALPLAVTYFFLFYPPEGLGQIGLFVWLTSFAILVRGAMTLYHVPHLALGAELSTDYQERTSIVAYRTLLSVLGGVGATILSYWAFFPETPEFPDNGLLNPAGYPKYALFCGVLMIITIWYSAWGTRKEIPHLPKAPEHPEPFSFHRIGVEFASAWKSVSFRSVFVGFALYGVFFGIITTLGTHINVFLWEFDTDKMGLLALPFALGFFAGAALVGPAHRRFDKRPTLIFVALTSSIIGVLPIALRLLGLFPSNDSPLLLPLIFVFLCVNMTFAAMGFVSAGSMMADVAEQHELESGKAQQGIFFSATSFSGKLASGMGHAVAGLGLDLIAFPLQADPGEVGPAAIRSLGVLNISATLIALLALWVLSYYSIDRAQQMRTRTLLEERHLPGIEPSRAEFEGGGEEELSELDQG